MTAFFDSTVHSVWRTTTFSTRTTRTTRLSHDYAGSLTKKASDIFLSPLNKMQKSTGQFTLSGGQAPSPLVRLVRLDSITRSLFPTRQARKFLSPLNEMQMSTRTTRLPLHGVPCQQDKPQNFYRSLNEMQMSTPQFILSTRIMSTALDNPLLNWIYYI